MTSDEVLEERVNSMNDGLERLEERVEKVEIKTDKLDGTDEELKRLQGRVDNLEENQNMLVNYNIKVNTILDNFENRIESIEGQLQEIVDEIKGLGDKLIKSEVRDDLQEKQVSENNELLTVMATKHGRMMLLLLIILGSALLFSMGMNVNDITELIPF